MGFPLESSRAVRETLDLIAAADETHIVLVDPIKGELYHGDEPGADVAAYLSRHGANVIVERVPSENRSVKEVLKDHATVSLCESFGAWCLRPFPPSRIFFRWGDTKYIG